MADLSELGEQAGELLDAARQTGEYKAYKQAQESLAHRREMVKKAQEYVEKAGATWKATPQWRAYNAAAAKIHEAKGEKKGEG